MIIYCPKCGWSCGSMPSILLNPNDFVDKDHKCKPPPTKEEKDKMNKAFPSWLNVKGN